MADERRTWRARLAEYGSLILILGIWLFILYYALFRVGRE